MQDEERTSSAFLCADLCVKVAGGVSARRSQVSVLSVDIRLWGLGGVLGLEGEVLSMSALNQTQHPDTPHPPPLQLRVHTNMKSADSNKGV